MCGKLVEYCKLFLPGGSVIAKKPQDSSALIVWRQQLTQWGQMLDDKVHTFAVDSSAVLNTRIPKRNRDSKPYVTPSYKRLTTVDKTHRASGGVKARAPQQVPEVVDDASPLVVYTLV